MYGGLGLAKAAVVQFEITGTDGAALTRFYTSLFGWQMHESRTPGYFVVGANQQGIPGGIGTTRNGGSGRVTFYVEVDDVLEHLSYAEELGGKIISLPCEVADPGGHITYAFLADPEGHVVGLTKGQRSGRDT